MKTPATTALFRVTATVEAAVPATNASDAMGTLCDLIRAGLGPDDPARPFKATISHARATAEYASVPEKRRES